MRRYLTNMDPITRPIVEEAIVLSGRRDIHIDPMPMPPLPGDEHWYEQYHLANHGYFSIYVDRDADCSDFWECYDGLKASKRWKTWLTLVESD